MSDLSTLILDRFGVITPLLYAAMTNAITRAESRSEGWEHHRFPHARPLAVRNDLRLLLENESLPEGWSIGGDSRKMGQLFLEDAVSGMRLRVLKAPYTQPDRVPIAGYNPARRQAWTASQPSLPDLEEFGPEAQVDVLRASPLLLLWAYRNIQDRAAGFDLRIVHPVEPGAFGRTTQCDLVLTIPDGGTITSMDLHFRGSAMEEDLFQYVIEDDETKAEA